MQNDQEKLAETVVNARKALKLSQTELAELAGLSRMPVYYLESGKGSVRLDNMVRILDVLGLELKVVSKGGMSGD